MNEPAAPETGVGVQDRRLQIAGLAISAVSLIAVVWWASTQESPELPSDATDIAALAGAVGVYAATTLARGERWWWLMRRSGTSPSRTDAYSLTVVGYMGNNVLPARGGDAIRVVLAAPRAGTNMRTVVGTLVAERLLDAVTLLGLFVILAYGVLRGIDAPSGTRLAIGAAALLVVAAIVAGTLYAGRHSPRVKRLVSFVAPMTTTTRELRGRYGAAMVLATVGIWSLEATTYFAVAGSVDLEISFIEAAYIVALASVFVLIPSGPGYLGTLDAAIVFGVRAVGGTGSEAVSFLLALRFVLLVPITLAGLVLLLARYGGRTRAAPAEAEPG